MRQVKNIYQDPVEIIWLHAAGQLGIQVVRDPEVFATWDGSSTLRIGTSDSLDPDDSLAQMLLHEICHWLVAGPEASKQEDWGLEYGRPEHLVYEHASLRLQAAFADQVGLRQFFASTTDHRSYFDDLPTNTLEGEDDPAIALAQAGWKRAFESDIGGVLNNALQKTREIANVVDGLAPAESLWVASANHQ